MGRLENSLFVFFGCAGFGLVVLPTKILGLFFIHLQTDLNASASMSSLALGINFSFMYIYGPLEAIVYKKFGAKVAVLVGSLFGSLGFVVASFLPNIEGIIASFALLSAFGIGQYNLSLYTMAGETFSGHLSLANNLFSISHSVLAFGFAPLVQLLINYYGWRGALLITGGFATNSVPMTLLLARYYDILASNNNNSTSDEKNNVDDKIENSYTFRSDETLSISSFKMHSSTETDIGIIEAAKRLLCNPCFLAYITGTTFLNLAKTSVVMYTVRYAQSVRIEDSKAVWILTLTELLAVVSGPVAGFLTSSPTTAVKNDSQKYPKGIRDCLLSTFRLCTSVPRSYVLVCFCVLYSISILIPVFNETLTGFLISGALNGIITGFIASLPITVISDLFPLEDLATAQGLRCLITGVGLLIYPLVVGHFIDIGGNYRPAQYVASLCSLVCAILTTITQIELKRKDKRKKQTIDTQRNKYLATKGKSIAGIQESASNERILS